MRLKITCNYPHDEVKRLVEFASKGVNTNRLRLWIKNSDYSFCGTYYHFPKKISARIGQTWHFPLYNHSYPGLKTAPKFDLINWREALVALVAHECRHHYQNIHHKKMSEIDAERWAVKKLEAYRQL